MINACLIIRLFGFFNTLILGSALKSMLTSDIPVINIKEH
ncbi:hypothetical protein AO385_0572 [Moraxella catarrhalis]|uniref:Uncharacterized protein n=1 Tax=Moraxella catarrhalis TaxID=480 RepID=A0A198UJ72_MORCA|nr:hypothetical protein AO384_0945 [Moraxella catarrhalis]OAU96895.1 hypothetical protein AO383_1290 [Moraxella catarrhalis]OAV03281.1 hypothetical protein AO385_0572 [Moraxella catarrhalis]